MCKRSTSYVILVLAMGGSKELLSDFEGLELSQEELEQLTLDDGRHLPDGGTELKEAEDMQPISHKKRRRSFLTGHKLRIITDFKSGLTQDQICKKHRISKTTLASILHDTNLQEVSNPTYISGTKKMMASRFYQLADLCLAHIDTEKLDRLDPYKLGVLASIALDKARLIEGQSTENLSFKTLSMNIHMTLDQLKEQKAILIEKLNARKMLTK